MLMAVNYCPNCKTISQTFILEVNGQPLFIGVLGCPLCHTIQLTEEWADRIATAIKERHVED